MDQPYANPYAQGMGPSAPLPTHGGGVPGVIVVDPRFCASYPVQMEIVRKVMKLTSGNFVITDVNRNMLFKVKDRVLGLHDKRTLLDASGSPVLTLKDKIMTMHSRWQVFRGGSTEERDLLYTVKKSSMVQLKKKLNVFLSHNKEEEKCDFRVKGTLFDDSCVVYAGESDAVVAQMEKKDTLRSTLFGKDHYCVTVNPNVDFAFIASLIVILDDINRLPSTFLLDMGLGFSN